MLGSHISKIEKRLARVTPIARNTVQVAAALRKAAFGYPPGQAEQAAEDLRRLLEEDVPAILAELRKANQRRSQPREEGESSVGDTSES
jgi:50S ribosomal subunit-associated GTPase HflX